MEEKLEIVAVEQTQAPAKTKKKMPKEKQNLILCAAPIAVYAILEHLIFVISIISILILFIPASIIYIISAMIPPLLIITTPIYLLISLIVGIISSASSLIKPLFVLACAGCLVLPIKSAINGKLFNFRQNKVGMIVGISIGGAGALITIIAAIFDIIFSFIPWLFSIFVNPLNYLLIPFNGFVLFLVNIVICAAIFVFVVILTDFLNNRKANKAIVVEAVQTEESVEASV